MQMPNDSIMMILFLLAKSNEAFIDEECRLVAVLEMGDDEQLNVAIDPNNIDELIKLGWVEYRGDDSVVVNATGKYWVCKWAKKKIKNPNAKV